MPHLKEKKNKNLWPYQWNYVIGCNPVAGFRRQSVEDSALTFGLQNWRKWQMIEWKQCCVWCVMTRPHLPVQNGFFSTNFNCSMGITKKDLHWKEILSFLHSIPVTSFHKTDGCIRKYKHTNLWQMFCKASNTSLSTIAVSTHLLWTWGNLKQISQIWILQC